MPLILLDLILLKHVHDITGPDSIKTFISLESAHGNQQFSSESLHHVMFYGTIKSIVHFVLSCNKHNIQQSLCTF